MHPPCLITVLSYWSKTMSSRPLPDFVESFWPLLQGYREVVQQSWNEQCPLTNNFAMLDYKLKRLAKCVTNWAKNYIGDIRKQM
jgi:hypothetical protein